MVMNNLHGGDRGTAMITEEPDTSKVSGIGLNRSAEPIAPELLPDAPIVEPETEPEAPIGPPKPVPDLVPFDPDWPEHRPEPRPKA